MYLENDITAKLIKIDYKRYSNCTTEVYFNLFSETPMVHKIMTM